MNTDIAHGLDELLKVCRPISLSVRWNRKLLCHEYKLLVFEETGQGSDVFSYKFLCEDGFHCVFCSRERYP